MTMCIEVCPEMVRGKGEHHLLLLQMSCVQNEDYLYSSIQPQKQALFCLFTHLSITFQLPACSYEFQYTHFLQCTGDLLWFTVKNCDVT